MANFGGLFAVKLGFSLGAGYGKSLSEINDSIHKPSTYFN